MKKFLISSLFLVMLSVVAISQPHPGQNNDGSTPTGGPLNGPGGGAPLGSGLTIMLVLGSAYGLKKLQDKESNKKHLL